MDTSCVAPRPFNYSAVALSIVGVALFAHNWLSSPAVLSGYLVLMIMAAVWSEHYAPVIGGHSSSIAGPMIVAAMTLGGPCAATLVASISAIRRDFTESRRSVAVAGFNFGQHALVVGMAGLIYVRLSGPVLQNLGMRPLVSGDFPGALLPMAAAVTVMGIGNMCVTAVGVSLLYRMSLRDSVARLFPQLPSAVALGFVGYLIAQVVASNVFALPLFLFPLMLARQLYQRYASMKNIYVDTVRSLVGALEAKDPYTRGHSVRVAAYSVLLGKKLGHDERAVDTLEKSALLHDIGKLALSSAVLVKSSKLSDEEFAAMRMHPAVGADMVNKIPPLRGLGVLVRNHHEWYNGAGYPDGLSGTSIHDLARILSVADAFDAMTTNRAYRPAMSTDEAVAELYRGVGTQFDPRLVDPFIEALREQGALGAIVEAGAAPPLASSVQAVAR